MSGRWDLLLEEDSTGEHPRITKGAIWWDGLVPVIVQDGTVEITDSIERFT